LNVAALEKAEDEKRRERRATAAPVPQAALSAQATPSPSYGRSEIARLQRTAGNRAVVALLRKAHDVPQTGTGRALPEPLRAGVESLSGLAMDDVRVDYDSPKPKALNAMAFTEGPHIFVGPGQREHLAHEAWHVVQQKQARVTGLREDGDHAVNDDPTLETEASLMGARAESLGPAEGAPPVAVPLPSAPPVAQLKIPGLEDINGPDDIPDDWVDKYIADLTDNTAHLDHADLVIYLDQLVPDWHRGAYLINIDGAHWDVMLTPRRRATRAEVEDLEGEDKEPEPKAPELKPGKAKGPEPKAPELKPGKAKGPEPKPPELKGPGEKQPIPEGQEDEGDLPYDLRINTRHDGDCGAHVVAVIRNRAAFVKSFKEGKKIPDPAFARPDVVTNIRQAVQGLGHDRYEIKQRIWTEVQRNEYVALTGFGRTLFAAVEQRAARAHSPVVTSTSTTSLVPSASPSLASGGAKEAAAAKETWEGEISNLHVFMDRHRYTTTLAFYPHELFQNAAFTLYPLEKAEELPAEFLAELDEEEKQHRDREEDDQPRKPKPSAASSGKARSQAVKPAKEKEKSHKDVKSVKSTSKAKSSEPPKGEALSMRTRPHRPILDIEIVGGRLYARCYIGLFAKAASKEHKDITADVKGNISVNSDLMNLGNPFKALLWCEDYLSSTEHQGSPTSPAPSPVLRSFLVPLRDADWMLDPDNKYARPLDQDRGSGQFGTPGLQDVYSKYLHPLAGSLVSFFHDIHEVMTKEEGQTKLPMALLVKFLTGTEGDVREMAPEGIAAQHGRKGHEAKFDASYQDALGAYYKSLEATGFRDATQDAGGVKTGRHKKGRADILAVDLSHYPHVVAEAKRRGPKEPKGAKSQESPKDEKDKK
jgi:hypothetical protein